LGVLVVVSNWGFTDGTLFGPPRRRPIDGFLSASCGSAVRAGFRRDGRYRPISRLDIVLAGDTFDWLMSSVWLGSQRPWRRSAATAHARAEVAAGALAVGRCLLGRLARLVQRGVEVPPADSRGRPALGGAIRIPVHVTLLAGDRDAWLEDEPCRRIANRFGLAVGQVWASGGVVVDHGSGWDPACDLGRADPGIGSRLAATGADRPPTLAESLSVDLLVPFARLLREHAATRESAPRLMRRLASVRPLALPAVLAAWLSGGRRAGSAAAWMEVMTAEIWRRAVDGWHRLARRDPPLVESEFDLVDRVATLMAGIGPNSLSDGEVLCEPLDATLESGDGATTAVYGHPSAPRRPGRRPGRIVCLGSPSLPKSSTEAGRPRMAAIEVAPTAALTEPEDMIRHVCVFSDDEYGGLPILSAGDDSDDALWTPAAAAPFVDAA